MARVTDRGRSARETIEVGEMSKGRGAPVLLLAVGTPAAALTLALEPVAALSLRLGLITVGVSAVIVGIVVHRPRAARAWWLVVAALGASLLGDLLAITTLVRGELTGTLPVDAWLTAAAGVLLIVAVVDATGCTRRGDRAGLLDAVVVALAAGTVVWSVLVVPAAAPGWVGSSVETAGSIQILLFAALIALVLRAYRRLAPGQRLAVGIAVAALLASTAAFLLGALNEAGSVVPYTGARAFAGAMANLLLGAAALHPTMRSFTQPPPPVTEPLDGPRTLRLGAALFAPVGVLVWGLLADRPLSMVVIVGAWALLVPSVLARLYLLGRDRASAERHSHATEQRLAALVAHTGDVLLLVQPADGELTIGYASPAARPLLGRDPVGLIGTPVRALVVPEDRDTLDVLLADAHEGLATADIRAFGPTGAPHWVQVIGARYADDDVAGALVVTLRDVAARKAEERRWVEAAMRDPGTGLANRRAIEQRLEEFFTSRSLDDTGVGVLMCDLDNFKAINDRHGHAVGDEVLREVAARMRTVVRRRDVVGRLGGDEFVVVCSLEHGRDALDGLAARVLKELSDPFAVSGRELFVGCSIGVAVAADAQQGGAALLHAADLALYRAKASGKGRVVSGDHDATLEAGSIA